MKKMFALSAAIVMGIASTTLMAAEGNAAAGKTRAAACAACHGADGNSMTADFPKLAGQSAGYIAKQLADFKSGKRSNPIMAGMAAGLSAQDMADLGAYYASQKTSLGVADETMVAAGQRLYRAGNETTGVPACMACHGPTGSGNAAARFPALSGQHAKYVVAQLKAFAAGQRGNDMNGMMRDVAGKMSDAEMKAVASYVSGLH